MGRYLAAGLVTESNRGTWETNVCGKTTSSNRGAHEADAKSNCCSPVRGIRRRCRAPIRQPVGDAVQSETGRGEHPRIRTTAGRPPAPCRFALRQGENAEWLLSKFREFGWDAAIEQFEVLFPTPRQTPPGDDGTFEVRCQARRTRCCGGSDEWPSSSPEQLPTYNAYSIDGDVTAPLVYVNYGRPSDYEELDRLGISVKGAIAIARYGACWRGIKPKVAAERGAVACIIYSDPRDDGYFEGDVFPEGPMRNRDGVQRGSVLDMPLYPGDPLTSRSGGYARSQTADTERDPHPDPNPRAPDFLRRRTASPRSPQGARCPFGMARGPAAHLSHRPRSLERCI